VSVWCSDTNPFAWTLANGHEGSNIANARVAGMNEELELTGAQYNMALTV